MGKPQATSLDHREAELFRGRARELDLARGLWSAPLPATGRRVLLFTGIGGIGKSALGRRIIREIGQSLESDGWLHAARPAVATIDLAEAASQDVVQALLQLRLQLGLTWREARFPLFDVAFARIHRMRFPGSDVSRHNALLNPDGAVLRRLAPALPEALVDSERLQDTANGINELLAEMPLIGTGYKYLNRVLAKGLEAIDRRTEPLLREIAGSDAALLDQRLPECLGLDLVNAIAAAERRRPVTLVIDTLEAIHRHAPQQSGIAAFQNDAWLRELVWQARGVGFLLLGRDDVEWPEFEHSPIRDWSSVVETRRLVELDDAEVDSILKAFPVPDADVAAAIRAGAAGLPFYLGLQVDIYRDLLAEGVAPAPEHFARAPKAVLARFADHLGPRLATAFTTLAHARRFDETLFADLKAQPGQLLGPVGLPEITRYSLVGADPDGLFRLHQHFQDIQREALAQSRPDDQRRIDEALFAYWDARCQPRDVRSLDAGHEIALREAAYHQRLLAPEIHVRWLVGRWWPFQEAARRQLCLELWETAFAVAERANGVVSAQAAAALGSLGIVLQMLNRLDDARIAHERALAIAGKVYGSEHHEVARTLGNLGTTLQLLGRLDDARTAQERSLAIKEKIFGPEHQDVAQTLGNLGNVLQSLGQFEDAEIALERALAIKEKVHGPEHLEVAITLGNLGNVLQMLGRLDVARAAQERALAIKETVYGPDHHEVARTLTNLGNVLQMLGQLDDARAAQERALAINESVFGSDHHEVAVTLTNLGIVQQMLGHLVEARAAQERALAINEMVYGRDHHEVAITLTNLGNVMLTLGQLSDAQQVLTRALGIKEAAHGPDHPQVAITLTNLGNVFRMLDQLDDARQILTRALSIKEAAYGPDHHEFAITLTNLGLILKALDDLPGARAAEERALAIFERRLPPVHPHVAQACDNLADTLDRLGEAERAIGLRARAAAIRAGNPGA